VKEKDLSKLKDLMKSSAGKKKPSQGSASPQTGGKQNLVLSRRIKVYRWNVTANISNASQRDDLMPVLQRARENKGTFAKDIALHLLGEEVGREVIGQRLLSICESLGLLENQGAKRRPRFFLTDEGSRALESKSVMVPEEGTWTIWASDDPLLKYPILRVEPLMEKTAYEELRPKNKKEMQERNKNFESPPKWLAAACSRVAKPSAVGDKLMRLDSIEKRVELIKSNSQVVLEWVPADNSLRLKGTLDGDSVNATPEAPGIAFKKVWNELLESEHLASQWQESQGGRLLVTFSSTTGAERTSMQRKLEFAKPCLKQFNCFNKTHQRVKVFPFSLKDAQQWANWSLTNRINTYAAESLFADWCRQAVQPFGEYSKSIDLPTRSNIAADAWKSRHGRQQVASVWHLKAVEDWGI